MLKYALKRFGMAVLTIFIIVAITFFTMHAIPASPFNTSDHVKSDAVMDALNAKYGFDKPLLVQFGNYLKNLARFDFGDSTGWRGMSVSELILGALSYSVRVGLTAALLAIVFGVCFGAVAALNRGRWADKVLQVATTALVSLPAFVLALLLLLVFGLWLRAVPTIGSQPGGLVMPTIATSLYPMAYITRLSRSSMLDVLGQDYIRTAYAKGVSRGGVIFKHALKNALSPVITYCGPMMAYILVGIMVIENIFSVPGLGRLFVSSMLRMDYFMVMGITIFLSLLIVLLNFAADLLYKVVDPRVSFE
jgi:oligopeptide transport system permease protein